MKTISAFRTAPAVAFFCLAFPASVVAQTARPIPLAEAKNRFAEAQTLCQADNGRLWGISLCGPMMFVDPQTRFLVANQADAHGALTAEAGVFTGTLPREQNISNTAVEWQGTRWTQILWPLPDDDSLRQTMMAHELFHRIQNQLSLTTENWENAQLDTVEGRYLFQLELRALARALTATEASEQKFAAADAILFRAERYRLFPGAGKQELALERNEGLAEYSGVRVGNATAAAQIKAAERDLAMVRENSTFVRSFAYATGPAYGLLLDRFAQDWHGALQSGAGLDELLRGALKFELPANTQEAVNTQAALYDGAALHAAEVDRDNKRQQKLAAYRARFTGAATFTVTFRHMNIQFDPRNLLPLDGVGTVYPTMRITDDWGILEVTNGALLKSDWSAVILDAPSTSSSSVLQGDGWKIELKSGWKLVPGQHTGSYLLSGETK